MQNRSNRYRTEQDRLKWEITEQRKNNKSRRLNRASQSRQNHTLTLENNLWNTRNGKRRERCVSTCTREAAFDTRCGTYDHQTRRQAPPDDDKCHYSDTPVAAAHPGNKWESAHTWTRRTDLSHIITSQSRNSNSKGSSSRALLCC